VDQIFDRFGNLLKSFLNDDDSYSTGSTSFSDPDLQDAWDELEDFLNTDDGANSQSAGTRAKTADFRKPELPANLQKDYRLLKTKPGAPLTEVAKSYRLLLRTHHPDRYASDPVKFAQATEKTKDLTTAFRRIKDYEKKNR